MFSDDAAKEIVKQELKRLELEQKLGEVANDIRALDIRRKGLELRVFAIEGDDPRMLSKLAALMRDDAALVLEQATLRIEEAKLLERIARVDDKINEIRRTEMHRQAASAVGSLLGSLLGDGFGHVDAGLFGGGSPFADSPFSDFLMDEGEDLGEDPLLGFNASGLFGRPAPQG